MPRRVTGIVRWGLGVGVAAMIAAPIAIWGYAHRDDGVRTAPDKFAADNARGVPFSVPEGYVAELVARSPLVLNPMYASFDDRGGLYVAGFSDQGEADHPDVIRRLEDVDGDGRFDRSTLFASGLSYPEGVLWHDGAVYASSPPSLWRFEDTDGDGWADSSRELLTGFPATGIADDLHGPSLGPDGRLYFGVGRFPYEIQEPKGPIIRKGQSPLVMRCRVDGSEAEVVSSGLGNPVGVAFTPEGEAIACGTFFAPTSMGEEARDAIIYCVRGGVFPVRGRVDHEDPSTGELLPPLVHLGVTAPSDLMRARGGPFGEEGGLTFYSALFNTHMVQSHRLERDGATFRSRNENFLVSTSADFHPTDVLEDADGSILVVDTGGWFRHCPTSQIDKPDVRGAIYRVRRRDAPRVDDPRGLKLDWATTDPHELVRRLDDPRFAVRDRAVARLARLGEPVVPPLTRIARGESGSARTRRAALWALARIEGAAARSAIRAALGDADASIRLTAVTAAGLLRDAESRAAVAALLGEGDPAIRREAATALGRIGLPKSVEALLGAFRSGGDRFLEHARLFALIEIADRPATLKGLEDPDPVVRRAALIALDQMPDGNLTPELVTPLLKETDPALRETALRVTAARPAWAAHFAEVIRPWLSLEALPARDEEILRAVLPTLAPDPAIQELVASALGSDATPVDTKLLLLDTIGRAKLPRPPKLWVAALRASLGASDPREVRRAAATIRTLHRSDFQEPLLRIARDTSRPVDLRLEALEAAAPYVERLTPEDFAFLIERLGRGSPPLLRMAAARCLGSAPLGDDQLNALSATVSRSGALTLPRLLPAYRRSQEAATGIRFVSSLERSPGLRSLSSELLLQTLQNYPAEVQDRAKPLFRRLNVGDAEKSSRLAELEPILGRGSPDRGREVFFGDRTACSTCHSVRGQGGRVGPELTRIGAIRTGRDLLEAILFPSASFARGYEPFLVATDDGESLLGVISQESADAILLVTPRGGEVRIPRSSIEELRPSRESIMPRGLEANMSRDELSDLVAFLASLK